MRKLLFIAAMVTALPCLTQAQVSGTGLKKITSKHFKTGLQTGFWEVGNKQQLTLDSIGKRPTSRVGFYSWDNFEDTNGNYNFSAACGAYQRAHNYGETVFGAINICFSDSVAGESTIPNQYVHDIANPVTQAAALKFLKNYVAYVLNHVGNITLTIDYEIMSNYKLNMTATDKWHKTTKKRAKDWHDWYIKAVRAARDTAAAMGKSNLLKLMPIVNGNPFDTDNPIHTGPSDTANGWLTDVVDSSDYLAFDTYQSDSATSPSSPQTTFKIMQFWIDSFSRSKDVIVTENGYNVSPSYLPGVTRASRKYKTTGTIQQADTFYRQLFDSLIIKAQPGGSFHGKMRSYNIWSICDNPAKLFTDPDYYFGIIGVDTTTHLPYARPALNTVRNGYARIDTSATLRPYDDSTVVNTATPDTVTYSNGDNFDYFRYRAKLGTTQAYYLHIKTTVPGNLMVHVNSSKWLYFPYTTSIDTNISNCGAPIYYGNSQNNVIEVYCTDSLFPFRQTVTQLNITTSPTARQASEAVITGNTGSITVYPNPAHTSITLAGTEADKPLRADIFNTMGQLVKTANTTEINIADLANGVYQVSIVQDGKTNTIQFVKE